MAGGNVETSQRVVDVLLGALGLAGASQGTMNNLLFGDTTFGYYETICGGSGATADGPGADAVQVHMTNTRLTDPELLERRFPVRVRRFSSAAARAARAFTAAATARSASWSSCGRSQCRSSPSAAGLIRPMARAGGEAGRWAAIACLR